MMKWRMLCREYLVFFFACIYIYVLHIFFLWNENDWTVRMNPAFINMEPASYEIELLKVS